MSLRITFQLTGAAAPVDLAPGGGRSDPERIDMSARNLAEIAEYLRAVEISPLDRGNFRHDLTFPVYREHATVDAAFLFTIEHPGAVCGVGEIVFIADIGGTLIRRRADAEVRIQAAEWEGIGTLTTYAVTCGRLTAP